MDIAIPLKDTAVWSTETNNLFVQDRFPETRCLVLRSHLLGPWKRKWEGLFVTFWMEQAHNSVGWKLDFPIAKVESERHIDSRDSGQPIASRSLFYSAVTFVPSVVHMHLHWPHNSGLLTHDVLYTLWFCRPTRTAVSFLSIPVLGPDHLSFALTSGRFDNDYNFPTSDKLNIIMASRCTFICAFT